MMLIIMKLRERIISVALVLLFVSFVGMAFSYFKESYHAMYFWGIITSLSFMVVSVLPNPHKTGKS